MIVWNAFNMRQLYHNYYENDSKMAVYSDSDSESSAICEDERGNAKKSK